MRSIELDQPLPQEYVAEVPVIARAFDGFDLAFEGLLSVVGPEDHVPIESARTGILWRSPNLPDVQVGFVSEFDSWTPEELERINHALYN